MRDGEEAAAGRALLDWYDIHARQMPWRIPPARSRAGERAAPYRVWLSEVMLQQTTVAAVRDYFRRFTALWPGVEDLARAKDAEVMAQWAGLGYYARARNLLKCARHVTAEHAGRFPADEAGLRALPGIGPYTAAAIAAIAYGLPAVVVDGNVERVVARLWKVEAELPGVRPALAGLAARLTPAERPGDHAQAMMDLGATICTPRAPACALCPLAGFCAARADGLAAQLPRKAAKPPKPERQGSAYVAIDGTGGVLLEERPARGLLGGMTGFPGSEWRLRPPALPALAPVDTDLAPPDHPALATARWTEAPVVVRHTFTHFHLTLRVFTTELPGGPLPDFTARADFRPAALPTLMRKVWTAAQAARETKDTPANLSQTD